MPKTKSNLSRITRNAKYQRLKRKNESQQERENRLTIGRWRQFISRSNESISERNERLQLDRIRHSLSRRRESQKSREQRQEKDRIRHAVSRSRESDNSREQQLKIYRHYQNQCEFEIQEQYELGGTELCDQYHKSQGERVDRLPQLRQSVSSIRQSETKDRKMRLVTARRKTSAMRDIENEEPLNMSESKVAIVTGSNKGLGLAMVKKLCAKYEGSVYLTARNLKRGAQAIEKLKKSNLTPIFHQLDVSDKGSLSNFTQHIQNNKIDILINNAGILFLKDSEESLFYQAEQTILINFFGLVDFCEAMIPCVQNGGKIVNISSSSGHLSRIPSEELRKKLSSEDLTLDELKALMRNYVEAVRRGEDLKESWGESPYVVSKVGVNAYTFILHRRLSTKGIFVNCVHPGYVISDMTKGAGNVTPEQAAEVPLKLALQPEGSGLFVWHNGATVPWDGPDPRGYIDGKL